MDAIREVIRKATSLMPHTIRFRGFSILLYPFLSDLLFLGYRIIVLLLFVFSTFILCTFFNSAQASYNGLRRPLIITLFGTFNIKLNTKLKPNVTKR